MVFDFRKLPRCGAEARSNHHQPCRQAAMSNGRCYWLGGAMLIKHGHCTKKAKTKRIECRHLINGMRKSLVSLEDFIYVDDLTYLDKDFDIAKANKHHLKYLRKVRSECPHLPESLVKKLALWERHFMGDLEATKEVLILCGLAQRGDFDFEKEDWFQPD